MPTEQALALSTREGGKSATPTRRPCTGRDDTQPTNDATANRPASSIGTYIDLEDHMRNRSKLLLAALTATLALAVAVGTSSATRLNISGEGGYAPRGQNLNLRGTSGQL